MLRLFKVAGDSLAPEYKSGDFVLAVKVPTFVFWRWLHPGDIILFHNPVHGTLLKRVEWLAPKRDEIFVVGSHPYSVDSRNFGPIASQAVIGKVIYHIKKLI